MATTTHGNYTDETKTTKEQRRRTYERVLGVIEHNTAYQQPAFIPRYRIEMIVAQGSVDGDRVGSVLQAAVRSKDLLRVRRGSEELYAYARDVEHLRAAIEAVCEWDPTPKDVVAWCTERIDALEADR